MTDLSDQLLWIMLANILIWLGIGGYTAFVAARQKMLAKRLKQMEIINNANDT